MIDEILKWIIVFIIISITLSYTNKLLTNFKHYTSIKELNNELTGLIKSMDYLKKLSSNGWSESIIKVPTGYYLLFNNNTNELIISGAENFSLMINHNIKYSLKLNPGEHRITIYYGNISFNELKNETLVFT